MPAPSSTRFPALAVFWLRFVGRRRNGPGRASAAGGKYESPVPAGGKNDPSVLIRRSGGVRSRLDSLVGGRPLPDNRRIRPPCGLSPRPNDSVLCSIFGRGSSEIAGDSLSGVAGGVVPVPG